MEAARAAGRAEAARVAAARVAVVVAVAKAVVTGRVDVEVGVVMVVPWVAAAVEEA
jgi:hypothetical protein